MFRKFQSVISLIVISSYVFSLSVNGMQKAESKTKLVSSTEQKLQKDLDKTLLLFEENKGQTGNKVQYLARANGYRLLLTNTETVFALNSSEHIKLNFVGANKRAEIKGENKAVTVSNYFSGQDTSKWLTQIPNFNEVRQEGIYKGIDVKFYGIENKQVEYDFIVSPNADSNQIKLNFDGAKNISIDEHGNLVLKTEKAELIQRKPVAYQEINGERVEVNVSYELSQDQVSFKLGDYDKSHSLTIDPVLNYLTYVGGSHCDVVDNVAADAQGNAFIVGATCSLDYPVANSRSDDDFAVFVTKISADGSTILYNTFLDGRDHDGISSCFNRFIGNDIAIDAAGNAYVAGTTDSGDFPITDNAYQKVRLCSRQFGACIFPEEVYVSKLNASGGIVYSTFLGGRNTDYANGIAVDSAGKAYVTGGTHSGAFFPTKNSYQGTGVFGSTGSNDAFMTVLNASGSDIVYSTGLGGNNYDTGNAITLDASNNVYITGMTESENSFPTKTAFQSEHNGGVDAFVAKFNATLSNEASLIYSTFLGGSGTDEGNGIAVNSGGQAHVVGITGSSNFPLLNAFRSTNQINEAFVTVLSSTGASLANSSFLGGADQERAKGVALDASGNIYVTGNTLSDNFPTALAIQNVRNGDRDAFVTKLKFGRGIISSSYLGGSDFDTGKGIAVKGNQIFVVGSTSSNNLATTAGVIKPSFGGGDGDGFVAKILDTRLDSVGVFRPSVVFQITQSITNITTQTLTFTTPLSGARGVSGDFDGDGIDTTGSFTNGAWKVRNVNFPVGNFAPTTFSFGLTGDLPVVGDWDGDGVDTAGTFRPSTGQFFLTNSPTAQAVNATINFGIAEDLPVAGDWNGDGIDSVGVFRPSSGQFFLTDDNVASPTIDQNFLFGLNGDLPTAGDYDGNGIDTIGVWRPSTFQFFLTNDNASFAATFVFGGSGGQPISGDWDGRPTP